jgi:acyl-coenzyme A thioesterase PaaI-like protein
MPFLPNSDGCYVCGRINPVGLHVRFKVDAGSVSTTFTPTLQHCSYQNIVHGGVLSALLDETMGWAPSYSKRLFCYAAELRVRFLKNAPAETPLIVRGWVTEDRGRICETEGVVEGPDGTVYARAWGKYVPMSPRATLNVLDFLHFSDETIPREAMLFNTEE